MKKLLLAAAGIFAFVNLFSQAKSLTVKEFLRLSEKDTTSYVVNGTVSKIRSSSSGSFYLKDDTGTMLIYGIQDPANPTRSFKDLDIKEGDTVSILGRFTLYAGTTKEMKDGRLLSKTDGPDHNLSFMERLDKKPKFKGKEGSDAADAFEEWVNARLKLPAGSEPGEVGVSYAIGRNGKIQEVQVTRSSGDPALDAEALRVVKSSPKWKPGVSHGSPVRLLFHLTARAE